MTYCLSVNLPVHTWVTSALYDKYCCEQGCTNPSEILLSLLLDIQVHLEVEWLGHAVIV